LQEREYSGDCCGKLEVLTIDIHTDPISPLIVVVASSSSLLH